MKMTMHTLSNKESVETISVADKVFAANFNEALIHQALITYMSGARAGTRAQKSCAEARGGGRKPWRQKGSGRARAGTIRSPLWRGGGVTFAAKPQDHSKKMNKKMYRSAMRSIFSRLVREERLICINEFALEEIKTKSVLKILQGMGLEEVLIITDLISKALSLATRNLPKVHVINADQIDPYSLVGFDKVLITKAALDKVEAWLA